MDPYNSHIPLIKDLFDVEPGAFKVALFQGFIPLTLGHPFSGKRQNGEFTPLRGQLIGWNFTWKPPENFTGTLFPGLGTSNGLTWRYLSCPS